MEKIVLDSMLRIPFHLLGPGDLRLMKEELTLRLPDAGDFGFGKKGPRNMEVFRDELDHLAVPRNWPGVREFLAYKADEFDDQRAFGDPIGLTFGADYRPGQEAFISGVLEGLREDRLGAIGQAGCGFGKTVCATSLIAQLDTTTLFVVHKEKLADQFVAACEQFLGYTPGRIQGGECDFEGKKICVGMIQSLHQKDYPDELYRHFGLVMVDECHRVAAPTFAAAIERFHSRYRIGLTATPRRGDKMEDVFHWHLGEVEAVGRGRFLDCSVYGVEWEPLLKPGQWQFRGKANLGKLITALSQEDARTDMIVRLILKAARAGRKILFLSDRCAHLDEIQARLRANFERAGETYTVGIFGAGATKKAERQREEALLCDIMGGTWSMASEGLDSPERDTVFFCTPKADVEQACGRIRRLLDGKKQPMVVDIIDKISFLGRLAKKRQRYYRGPGTDKSPWPVKIVSRIAS